MVDIRPRMTLKFTLAVASLAMLLGLAAGCSQKESFTPDFIGGLGTDTLLATGTLVSTFESSASLGKSADSTWASTRLVVSNWRGYLSRALLQFSSLPDSTVEITKATLFLYATRIESPNSSSIFGVYAVPDSVSLKNLAWVDLQDLGDEAGVFSLGSPDPDTIATDSALVDVTTLVTSWVKNQTPNWGLAVKLQDEAASDVIAEFAARDDLSTRKTAGGDTTFAVHPVLRIAYVESDSDSVYVELSPDQDCFVDTLTVPRPDTLLTCANGAPARTFIKFDVSTLPREATVISAKLKLTADMDLSSFDEMTLVCHALLDTVSGFHTKYGSQGAGTKKLIRSNLTNDPSFTMTVTALIQPVVSGLVTSYGFVIKSPNEKFDLDYAVLVSTGDGHPNLAPRLEIEYIMPPLPWYRKD